MLFSTLSTAITAVATLICSVNAAPAWPGHPLPPRDVGLAGLSPLMPKNTLPAPTGVLKYVLLGIGTQNYTCTNGSVATFIPGTTGALATLYDIGTKLDKDSMAAWKINTISGLALSLKSAPQQLDWYLQSQGYQNVLGQHFFTELVPTFSLNKVKSVPFPLTFVSKKAEMDAPTSSCPGTAKEGAVKWLQLVDDKNISQGGINTVYRLETAGGKQPATCQNMKKTFEVPYAAQYWIYGPAS